MKAYLDNNIVCAIAKGDLGTFEMEALDRLLQAFDRKDVEVVTSELTLEEIKGCPPEHRGKLQRTYLVLEKVPIYVAAQQGCAVFITCDNTPGTSILQRGSKITGLAGIDVLKPSQLVARQRW